MAGQRLGDSISRTGGVYATRPFKLDVVVYVLARYARYRTHPYGEFSRLDLRRRYLRQNDGEHRVFNNH